MLRRNNNNNNNNSNNERCVLLLPFYGMMVLFIMGFWLELQTASVMAFLPNLGRSCSSSISNKIKNKNNDVQGATMGDDFEGYDKNSIYDRKEGYQLAQQFYHELQAREEEEWKEIKRNQNENKRSTDLRQNQPPSQQKQGKNVNNNNNNSNNYNYNYRNNNNQLTSAGLFRRPQGSNSSFNRSGLTVYSSSSSSSSGSRNEKGGPRVTTTAIQPPTPTYGSPVKLSISGVIGVILLSRYFWIQTLIAAGLIGFYIAMIAILSSSSSNGGDGGTDATNTSIDWIIKNNSNFIEEWSTIVKNGFPTMERTTTTNDGTSPTL